ncbi:MAG TPA: hypothetical protein VF599_12495 [Pyrinomonadaceae bacterium]|jgi:hypothetical protein
MIITKDAEWIYKTLAEAFTKETGKEWQSYSRIQLKHSIPELNETEKTQYGKAWLEISYIEFEIEDAENSASFQLSYSTKNPPVPED